MNYNFIFDNLDFSNPYILIVCLVLIIFFLFIGHKVIIPFYNKYLKKYVQGKKKKVNL